MASEAGIIDVGYDGGVTELGWAKLSRFVGRDECVGTPTDCVPSAVPAVDRTVSISAGDSYAMGVLTTLSSAKQVVLGTVAAGVRWDTIVIRRDWQTNTSTVVAIPGTATEQVAAGLNVNPGVIYDQVIALAQVTAGQQVPTAIRDLRRLREDGGLQPGDILFTAASTPDVGTLVANGQEVSRSTYSRLFARIGTVGGAGNGSTTFNVPNLIAVAPVGAGARAGYTTRGLGAVFGAEAVVLGVGEMPWHGHDASHGHGRAYGASYDGAGAHAHNASLSRDVATSAGAPTSAQRRGGAYINQVTDTQGGHNHSVFTDVPAVSFGTGGAGGGAAHNNLGPRMALTPLIKF